MQESKPTHFCSYDVSNTKHDKLPYTTTGMDNLQAWFLRIGASVFCKPVAYLFSKSMATVEVRLYSARTEDQFW